MYFHNEMTHRVDWNPSHTAHAVTAMREIVDGSYSEGDEPIEVDRETADEVNKRYRELVQNDPDINTSDPEP
jgi:hypothetical protein